MTLLIKGGGGGTPPIPLNRAGILILPNGTKREVFRMDNEPVGYGDSITPEIIASQNVNSIAFDSQGYMFRCDNGLVQKVNSSQTASWSVNIGEGVGALAVDNRDNLVIGTSTGVVKRLSAKDGSVLNTYATGIGRINSLLINHLNGYLYVASYTGLKKYDLITGELKYTHSTKQATSIQIDTADNVYVSYYNATQCEFCKLGTTGSLVYSKNTTTNAESFAVDTLQNAYLPDNGQTLYKYNRDGVLSWSLAITARCVITWKDDNVYVADYSGNVKKIKPDKTVAWTVTSCLAVNMFVDSSGNIYAFQETGSVTKISPNGQKIWTYTKTDGTVFESPYNQAIGSYGEIMYWLALDAGGETLIRLNQNTDWLKVAYYI